MKEDTKFKVIKISLLILAIAIFIALIIYLFPLMKNLSTRDGQIKFKEEIGRYGLFSGVILFLLELAQIFLVVLPGEPLEVLAGMFYGSIGGSIFIFFTVFVTTLVINLLVKKFGKNLLYAFFKKEKIDKILDNKIFKNTKKIEMIMIVLFILPGTPKDLLVYLGGLLPISTMKFTLISTFTRFPSVISSTIAGASITSGNFHITIISYIISFVFAFILIFIIRRFDKNKITKEAIYILK